MTKKLWADKWEKGEVIGQGGQGVAYRAKPKNGPEGEYNYVLKLLKRQNDSDRRARMNQEVANLAILDHPGIAKCLDTNAHDFRDEVELYMVSEWVEGPNLRELVERGPLPLGQATVITLRVLDIVEYCHDKGVLHRDIKPEHVILRNGQMDAPVLLDFGLSFNEEVRPSGFETDVDQQLGNRFINLPELTGQGKKRYTQADITQCVALLFYAMTGMPPVNLMDHQNLKPHERDGAKDVFDRLSEHQRDGLKPIFDQGFSIPLAQRWQSAGALSRALKRALLPPDDPQEKDLAETLEGLRESLLNVPETQLRRRAQELTRELVDWIEVAISKCYGRLDAVLSWTGLAKSSHGIGAFRAELILSHKWADTKATVAFDIRLEGAELVVTGYLGKVRRCSLRVGLYDQSPRGDVDAFAGRFFVDCVKETFQKGV